MYGDLEEFVELPVGQDLPPAILNLPREGLKELVVPQLDVGLLPIEVLLDRLDELLDGRLRSLVVERRSSLVGSDDRVVAHLKPWRV